MRFIVTQLDIAKTSGNWPNEDFKPAFVYERRAAASSVAWRVADAPVPIAELAAQKPGAKISWAVTDTDEYVRIPLFAYSIVPQGDLALAFMFQLGAECANSLGKKVSDLHIVSGSPVELVYAADGTVRCMNYWFGFAAAMES
jgi:hypothetical protein